MRPTRTAILVALTCTGLAACDARKAEEGGGGGDPTSGAHTIHLTGTIARGLSCVDCHDTQFQVTFPEKVPPAVALARANGAQPTYSRATLTCSNVYCHDGGPQLQIGGGTVPTPVWNPPTPVACGGCHALPGGSITTPWHPQVAAGVQCALCHPGYTNSTVNRALHVNGVVDLTRPDMETNCTACHGTSTVVVVWR
jgi:predicted CxxxxCH...CXXCH cytochrome family protein